MFLLMIFVPLYSLCTYVCTVQKYYVSKCFLNIVELLIIQVFTPSNSHTLSLKFSTSNRGTFRYLFNWDWKGLNLTKMKSVELIQAERTCHAWSVGSGRDFKKAEGTPIICSSDNQSAQERVFIQCWLSHCEFELYLYE